MYTDISLNAYYNVNLSLQYQYLNVDKTKQFTNVASMFISVKVTLSIILANMYNRFCWTDCPMTVTNR